MSKTIVERFLIGGTNGRPSMPSEALQRALGSTIAIDVINQVLHVPTKKGYIAARKGDTILYYSDGSYDVERKKS